MGFLRVLFAKIQGGAQVQEQPERVAESPEPPTPDEPILVPEEPVVLPVEPAVDPGQPITPQPPEPKPDPQPEPKADTPPTPLREVSKRTGNPQPRPRSETRFNVDRVEFYRGKDKMFYFRRVAANNRIVASGEGYQNRADSFKQARTLFGTDVAWYEQMGDTWISRDPLA